ncbi:MAG: hypothetical protein LUE64_06125 [Candidatus Gastranaerophilales bacterium]|nr:hypothetical protein [Candidatus Gastranaerophilales bacterium]
MSDKTTTLNLYKTDMDTDGNDYFDFDRDLNENWEKIDARFTPQDIVLTSTDWDGESAPYTQTVEVEGMTEDINPHVSLISSDDYDTAQTERNEFAKLYRGESGDGIITFYATSPTGIDINIRIKRL